MTAVGLDDGTMDAAALRRERERMGLSVDEPAAELEVSTELLRRWEAATARIPRRQVRELPAQLARVERERRPAPSRGASRRKRKRTSRIVFLVPALLVVAAVIGCLPASDWWFVALYPIALAVGGILVVNLHEGLPWLRRAGALGRWCARVVAASAAMVGFVGTFLVSGYGGLITDGESLSLGSAVLLGVAMDVGYATVWPIARDMRRVP